MIGHYIFDHGFISLNISQYKGICMSALLVILTLFVLMGIIWFFVLRKKRPKEIIIITDVNSHDFLQDHIWVLEDALKNTISIIRYYCIFCADEYVQKNHKKILYVLMDTFITNAYCKEHRDSDINCRYFGEPHGGSLFYNDFMWKSKFYKKIPILMYSFVNSKCDENIEPKRKQDLYLYPMMPTELLKITEEYLNSQE